MAIMVQSALGVDHFCINWSRIIKFVHDETQFILQYIEIDRNMSLCDGGLANFIVYFNNLKPVALHKQFLTSLHFT